MQLSEEVVPLIWQDPPVHITDPEKVLICIWQLEAEVNNGGFSQYYYNSAGDLAVDTPASLEAIGASRTAEIVRVSNELFPEGPPCDQDSRVDLLDEIPNEAFERLDDQFLAYEDNLSMLLYDYVQLHKAEIRGA
jgi:hypothetical protein